MKTRKNTILETSKIIRYSFRILFPLLMGGVILWWMYRDFDWETLWKSLNQDTNWTWMWLSMPFGITAQVFRALRWKQSLEPLGESPRLSISVNAIFLSYASSLVVPRIGEVLRCGVLRKYDDVPFTKALGTVVTERIVDSVFIALLALVTVLLQMPVFLNFFNETGVNITTLLGRFTVAGYWVSAICILAVIALLVILAYKLSLFSRTRKVWLNLLDGLLSLRKLKSVPLYLIYSVGIWLSYYLHFYVTFYSFASTENLGAVAALVAFVVGCFAVLVPTPNGAGPWHFAVKTILVLYGVSAADGVMYVLIVHTLQTLLVLLLGIYAIIALSFIRKNTVRRDIKQ